MENESRGLAETPKVEPVQPVEPFPASVTPPVISPVPETPKKSNKKLFLIVGLVILMLVLMAGGIGAYFLMRGQEEASPTPTPEAVATPTPTASPDPTADWEIYNSEEYKFSFRYPKNWRLGLFPAGGSKSDVFDGGAYIISVDNAKLLNSYDGKFSMISFKPELDESLFNPKSEIGKALFNGKEVVTRSFINNVGNTVVIYTDLNIESLPNFSINTNYRDEDSEIITQILESFEFLEAPYFSEPTTDSKVASPLIAKGVVPTGWMFEGNVPVKLLDDKRNVITQAPGTEVSPGTWMDEEPDEFISKLTFTTTAKNGYLVVAKSNPSGNPENDEVYEIPVSF